MEAPWDKERVAKDITEFFCWNRGTAPVNIVGGLCKAFICGIFISIKAFRDKQMNKAQEEVIVQIEQLEEELKDSISYSKSQRLQILYQDLK